MTRTEVRQLRKEVKWLGKPEIRKPLKSLYYLLSLSPTVAPTAQMKKRSNTLSLINCSKCFIHINLLNLHKNLMGWVLLLAWFYRWRNRGKQRLYNLPKITQEISGGASNTLSGSRDHALTYTIHIKPLGWTLPFLGSELGIHSFILSLNKDVLSTYWVVGTFLGSGAIPVNKQTKFLPLWSLPLNEEGMEN